ncbi:TPA: hypothetical protein HA231_00960 [Candidatus Woesearchaeota archaeon]|nr:hypothetical protein [Candidatus Woesearchaeota archaeon]
MKTAKHAKYYESILQLRNPSGDVDDMVHRVVGAVNSQNAADIFISKKKKVTNGVDIYLSSNRFAVEIGRDLFRAFGGEFKVTKKLFSQHRLTSRLLYRVTVLFRMAPFKVGDFILLEDEAFKVLNIAKIVLLENLGARHQVELAYKAILRNFEKLGPVKVVVSKIKPHLEVIHPKTFQSVPVLPIDKSSRFVPGEKIRVIFSEGNVWRAA